MHMHRWLHLDAIRSVKIRASDRATTPGRTRASYTRSRLALAAAGRLTFRSHPVVPDRAIFLVILPPRGMASLLDKSKLQMAFNSLFPPGKLAVRFHSVMKDYILLFLVVQC